MQIKLLTKQHHLISIVLYDAHTKLMEDLILVTLKSYDKTSSIYSETNTKLLHELQSMQKICQQENVLDRPSLSTLRDEIAVLMNTYANNV